MRQMISFDLAGGRFNFRVSGVVLDRGRVLLHRAEADTFWQLPGGRAELLETAEMTVRREFAEELGTPVEVERLLWVVENFFGTADRRTHELDLTFQLAFPVDSPLYEYDAPFTRDADDLLLIFQWFRQEELAALPLLPPFLPEALRALPAIESHHVVNVEGEE